MTIKTDVLSAWIDEEEENDEPILRLESSCFGVFVVTEVGEREIGFLLSEAQARDLIFKLHRAIFVHIDEVQKIEELRLNA